MDTLVNKYKKRNNNQNCSTVCLSENILHLCCILCCMEDWWKTSTSLIECWRTTWLSELLRLLAGWCDSLVVSVGAVMDYLACWWTLKKWGSRGEETLCLLPILKSCTTRNWHRKPLESGIMKMSIDQFPLWVFFVVVSFCSESVHKYYGNRRQAWRERWRLFDPQARNTLLTLASNSRDEVHGTIHA